MDRIEDLYSMCVKKEGSFLDNLSNYDSLVKELERFFKSCDYDLLDQDFWYNYKEIMPMLFYVYLSKYFEDEINKIKEKYNNIVDIEIEKQKLEIIMEEDWTYNALMNYIDSPDFLEQYNFRIVKICNYNLKLEHLLYIINDEEEDTIIRIRKLFKAINKSSFSPIVLINYICFRENTSFTSLSNSVSQLMKKISCMDKVESIYSPNFFSGNLIDFYSGKNYYGYQNDYSLYYIYPFYNILTFTNKVNKLSIDGDIDSYCYDFSDFIDKKCDLAIFESALGNSYSTNINEIDVDDDRFSIAGLNQFNDLSLNILNSLYYLNDNGICVTNCSQGFLFKSGPDMKFRQYLIDNNYIDGIINLPAGSLEKTHVPASIIVLKKVRDNDKIKLLDATSFFEKKDRGRTLVISPENINKVFDIYYNQKENDEKFVMASYEEIIENNYDLSFDLYVEHDYSIKYDFENSKKKINSLTESVKELENSLDGKIKELEQIL